MRGERLAGVGESQETRVAGTLLHRRQILEAARHDRRDPRPDEPEIDNRSPLRVDVGGHFGPAPERRPRCTLERAASVLGMDLRLARQELREVAVPQHHARQRRGR